MAIPNAIFHQLSNEGINTVNDVVDFDKDILQKLSNNLRHPGGRIPDPTPGAASGATIATPPIIFGAKSQETTSGDLQYRQVLQNHWRPPTVTNIQGTPTMRKVGEKWKYLKERQ